MVSYIYTPGMAVATSGGGRGGVRAAALAAAIFLLLTILLTWPAAFRLSDGITDNLDGELNAWILNWDYHQLLTDPGHLFDANIFYPARYALAFSENLLGVAILGFPLLMLGMSYIHVYNILLLLGFFSSGFAGWALAREITGDASASLVAGVLYAFVPWRFAQISHFQFQWGAFLALALLFLLRCLRDTSRRDLILYGSFLLWNALANLHYAIFSVLLVLIVLLEDASGSALRNRLPLYWRVALVSLIAAALFLPIALTYQKAATLHGLKRTLEEASSYCARPKDFLDAGGGNWLYGSLAKGLQDRREAFFPGLTALLLGAFGATSGGYLFRRVRRLGLLLAGIGILLALGTNTPVYPTLYRISGPLLQAIRVPARAIVLFHLGLGILAAIGLSALRVRVGRPVVRFAIAAGLLGLVTIEYASVPLFVFWADARPAAVYRWIASAPLSGAVIEMPFGLDHDIEYVYRSPLHFRPLVNGYSGFFPKEYDALNALFEKRPIPAQAWQEVTRLGAKVAVYHTDLLTDAREVAYARLLRSAVTSAIIIPIRFFDHSGRKDFVFTVGMPPPGLASPDQVDSARKEFDSYLSTADAQQVRPFGWIDYPTDGQFVSPGDAGLGWALARSGVSAVRLATDQGQGGQADYGVPHPGVPKAYPGFPDSDRAGFSFHIPSLPHGAHPLYLTLVSRDGAEAVIVRWIRVRRPRG